MDDDTNHLIAQLCTRAGIIMEDASAVALLVGGRDLDAHRIAIAELAAASRRIEALVAAAKALLP